MVQTWAFIRLPLGALLQNQPLSINIFKAVLEGLNDRLTQQHHQPRCKLHLLDLHINSSTNFWRLYSQSGQDSLCSTEEPDDTHPKIRRRKLDGFRPRDEPSIPHMEVHVDLYLHCTSLDKFLNLLLHRVSLSKGALKLCCRNLEFLVGPPTMKILQKLLQNLQLEWVKVMALESNWNLATLATLAPHLANMIHLRTLCLRSVTLKSHTNSTPDEVDELDQMLLKQFSFQFINLQLQELQLDTVLHLNGCMHHLLQHFQHPLQSLVINHCWSLDSDLAFLSTCLSTGHLRFLSFTEVTLENLNPVFLNNLLDTASSTLQILDLSGCGLTDSQVDAIMPTLGHCSELLLFISMETRSP
ncbi:melanoma antigen preferentially expressed in tumors-like [Rhynchocyon petersi]